ncbi:uncharacterized protein EV422DRAFT_542789 [Fimicolochytrium jonesii]|uniref:uncharacterized protein n=1 Tax=Fimicolochytrium jonesii TaxID=1396493 RepID=UPI0022FDC4DB|nr:uncharacterized protein EV422DRAFT_542789 [Fimicolochytrium jonesii]KAI8817190.1 hypothetical protein EV422DRAFT_542789 [Fimicolochytrium jonesii]
MTVPTVYQLRRILDLDASTSFKAPTVTEQTFDPYSQQLWKRALSVMKPEEVSTLKMWTSNEERLAIVKGGVSHLSTEAEQWRYYAALGPKPEANQLTFGWPLDESNTFPSAWESDVPEGRLCPEIEQHSVPDLPAVCCKDSAGGLVDQSGELRFDSSGSGPESYEFLAMLLVRAAKAVGQEHDGNTLYTSYGMRDGVWAPRTDTCLDGWTEDLLRNARLNVPPPTVYIALYLLFKLSQLTGQHVPQVEGPPDDATSARKRAAKNFVDKIHKHAWGQVILIVLPLMLANKAHDDNAWGNPSWHTLSGIPLLDLGQLEWEFLKVLDFDTHVKLAEYKAWKHHVDTVWRQGNWDDVGTQMPWTRLVRSDDGQSFHFIHVSDMYLEMRNKPLQKEGTPKWILELTRMREKHEQTLKFHEKRRILSQHGFERTLASYESDRKQSQAELQIINERYLDYERRYRAHLAEWNQMVYVFGVRPTPSDEKQHLWYGEQMMWEYQRAQKEHLRHQQLTFKLHQLAKSSYEDFRSEQKTIWCARQLERKRFYDACVAMVPKPLARSEPQHPSPPQTIQPTTATEGAAEPTAWTYLRPEIAPNAEDESPHCFSSSRPPTMSPVVPAPPGFSSPRLRKASPPSVVYLCSEPGKITTGILPAVPPKIARWYVPARRDGISPGSLPPGASSLRPRTSAPDIPPGFPPPKANYRGAVSRYGFGRNPENLDTNPGGEGGTPLAVH